MAAPSDYRVELNSCCCFELEVTQITHQMTCLVAMDHGSWICLDARHCFFFKSSSSHSIPWRQRIVRRMDLHRLFSCHFIHDRVGSLKPLIASDACALRDFPWLLVWSRHEPIPVVTESWISFKCLFSSIVAC